MLAIPSYIAAASVVGKPLKHAWNDDEPDLEYQSDPRTERAISAAANRAILALSAASAEWIAWRVSAAADSTPLFEAIEAAYAGVVDWRYVRPLDRKDAPWREKWHGPARGAISEAYFLLDRLIGDIRDESYLAEDATMLMKLARHVMPNPKPFRDWYRAALARLVELHPKSLRDQDGAPVPRQACDPQRAYRAKDAPELLREYFAALDRKRNKLLATPAEMKKAGFTGTPYAIRL
ncbi:MAG TPA: hypothetical protein VMJ10_28495 [Kofleriaceae bacterium]|nr:hypothetical protein [Kofleriaceae bacterium]